MNTAAFEATPYGARALEDECRAIAESREGERNNKLNARAFNVAQLVAGGEIPEAEADRELVRAALACGLNQREARATITSAFKGGMKNPRSAPHSEPMQRTRASAVRAAVEPPPDDWEPTDDGAPDAPPAEPPLVSTAAAFEISGVRQPTEQPTASDPLRGLKYLSSVALVGRERILQLAAAPVEYVWQDIAVAGTIVLIAGPPAEGKTTLLFLILAARMNLGAPVTLLGRAIQPAGRDKWVVLIEGEHSEASTSRKLIKSLKLLELDSSALDRVVVVARKAVLLGSPEWTDVVRMASAGLVSDIAIDTLARVAPADADSEQEQVAVFNAVACAIEAAPEGAPKPIVWAVAHTRKNNTNGDLGDVAGSAQRTGQADTVLLIKGEKVDGRTVSTKVVFAKLREDPDDYPMPACFAIEADADGVLKLSNSDGKVVTDNRPLEVRITEKLQSGPKTKTALRTLLGRNFDDIEAAITNLFSARAIEPTSVSVGGRSYSGFGLRTSTVRAPYPGERRTSAVPAEDES